MVTPTPTSPLHSLPAIPTLPPIQMPDDDDYISIRSNRSLLPIDPASSTASSPISTSPAPLPCHPPQQSIRKSVSVDSFITFERDNSATPAGSRPRPIAHTTVDSSDPRKILHARRHDAETAPLYVRTRGMSMTTWSDGHNSAVEQNFDSDSWQPLKKVSEKTRRGSLKGKEQARQPSRRPGDLKLPARNQFPPVTTRNLPDQLPQFILRDDMRRLHSTTSLQSFPRHSPLADAISGRVRSGSLGLQVNSTGRGFLADTGQPMVRCQPISITKQN